MGRPKAWLRFGDEYLLQRVVRIVDQVAEPVVIATRPNMKLPALKPACSFVYDRQDHAGPLAGIAAGMTALREECDAVLVSPCDHPFINPEVLLRMVQSLGGHQGVAPERNGMTIPTLAVYRLSTLPLLQEMLRTGERRAQVFAKTCGALRLDHTKLADIDPDLCYLSNLNEPEAYASALNEVSARPAKGISCAL